MDAVPFTLFFMVCLISFHGSLGMPHEIGAPGVWPEQCAGKSYCFVRPADYPNKEKIEELFKTSDMDVTKIQLPTLDDRSLINDCRVYKMKDVIYMIKDTSNNIRYVMQEPSIFEYTPEIEECHKEQDLEENTGKLECRQKYEPLQFVVMTLDRKSVELTTIQQGLPSSCGLEAISEF